MDGAVVSVVVWDGGPGWSPPEGSEAIPLADLPPGCGVGWTRDRRGAWSPPEPVREEPDPVLLRLAAAEAQAADLAARLESAEKRIGGRL